ncbi:uncharacterized protein Dana_GF24321 [Drosophila ananassae]|uniref:Transmembrane protein 209 n=1 Tax=Drosophila ananassae TaxID=7217 RepID=B3M6B4_DROAN|nr:transmembrane protein 209 [Drosophila ananassae]EDV39734.1 uncharacterized protein Dana_GF24321 [Drosophila ananassae]
MNFSRSNCSPLRKSPVVQRSLDFRLRSAQARHYLKWCSINVLLLSLLLFDLWQACRTVYRTYWFLLECTITSVVGLSAVACFVKYLWLWCGGDQVIGTDYQKYLLDGKDDNSFRTVYTRPSKKPRSYDPDTDFEDDVPYINWHSSFEDSCWGSQSMRRSPSPTRTPTHQQNPQNTSYNNSSMVHNNSLNASNLSNESNYMSPYADICRDDFLTDPRRLSRLMKKAERERKFVDSSEAPNTQSVVSANSFWNYCNNAAYMLKSTIYQLAPAPPVSTENAPSSIEEFAGFQFKDSNSEVIKRISTDKLSQYVANLRFWISTTILQRLVKEINFVDDVFRQRGLVDLKIGSVGLERLRKTAENQQFVQTCAPMLPMLLPFLDTFSNQEYLVQRIRELAQGSCIADYRWNSGNTHKGQEWGEHLPTDAAILFHVFCVYLDSQLMPLPQGGGRPFHSRYVLTRDEKRSTKDIVNAVHNKAHCAILVTSNQNNPKFNFISDKELHNSVYDRNNLFYVIIQFLIYMRQQQESALEGVNLGKSGINIMCVIED